ncbi:MAG: hypothetical protein HY905_04125 [Deltaproteobacteria bacterium]|nr:hypothetical protein [Deltaproteobacteria bacterium]
MENPTDGWRTCPTCGERVHGTGVCRCGRMRMGLTTLCPKCGKEVGLEPGKPCYWCGTVLPDPGPTGVDTLVGLGLVTGIIVPFVGAIVALILYGKQENTRGNFVAGISVIGFLAWYFIWKKATS